MKKKISKKISKFFSNFFFNFWGLVIIWTAHLDVRITVRVRTFWGFECGGRSAQCVCGPHSRTVGVPLIASLERPRLSNYKFLWFVLVSPKFEKDTKYHNISRYIYLFKIFHLFTKKSLFGKNWGYFYMHQSNITRIKFRLFFVQI